LAPSQREQLDTASASADTLLELLSDILDFSKIEAGHLQFEHLAFAPAAVARSVCDLLRPRASAKGLTLGLELAASVPVAVIGDPTRLRQVLFNLVGNAVKFTASGQIELRVHVVELRPTNTLLRFTVTDSGIGMDADTLGRLFRPFSQADSSMTRRFGGTGLGLAICKKLVEAMHGTLEAQSKPEAGSVFTFTLPFERGANLAPPPAPNEFVMPQLRGRILVVEDEKTNQRVIGHFLKKMGLESELAEDGNSAVELALRGTWAAILMDCQLPGIDGLEATRRIRARLGGRSLPIIALTANASTEDRAACLAAGMDEFLTKPVRIELLAAMLQRHLPGA
jgi:CheY-like chemotaxis protein